jgi:hypothetical protein
MNDLQDRLPVALQRFAYDAPSASTCADGARHRGNQLKHRRQVRQRLAGAGAVCLIAVVAVVALGNRASSRRDVTGISVANSTTSSLAVATSTVAPTSSAPTTFQPPSPEATIDDSLYPDVVMIADPVPAGTELAFRSLLSECVAR